jgi:hypothetical protein
MTTLRLPNVLRDNQRRSIVAIVAVVVVIGYIMLLSHEENVMREYYDGLRSTNANLYLSKILKARGFDKYLDEYLALHDYGKPTEEAPLFLVGRWALFDDKKRVGDDFVPDTCVPAVEIEDGNLKFIDNEKNRYTAHYTMNGPTVTAHIDGRDDVTVQVVGYGSHLHHIEVHDKSTGATRYGYMCR